MIKHESAYRKLPNLDNHMCFACSPMNPIGLKMEFFSDSDTVVSWVKIPEHFCGWGKVAHGGIIATILDEIMGRTCLYLLKKGPVTKSITVDFLKPLPLGKKLAAQGHVVEVSGEYEVLVEGRLFDEKGELCARSKGSFVLLEMSRLEEMGIADKALLDGIMSITNAQ